MTKEQQITRFATAVLEFAQCILSISEDAFLQKLNRWTPRDIIAHLVGWNRYIIRGSRQIVKGQLPFYDVDPGEDYSNVNAELIHQYSSTDREELLDELTESADELKQFLLSLDENEWDRDFGIKHNENVVTIRNSVEGLLEDYPHHRKQIETWASQMRRSI